MSSIPPFIAQERSDTCALACLRMLLAQRGQHIPEAEIVAAAGMVPGGMNPEELALLAGQFGFMIKEKELDRAELLEEVTANRFPIVYLYRGPLDGEAAVHAVIPIRFSRHFVTFLDPLRGRRRVSIRKFEEAHRLVGRWVILQRHG